MSPTTRLATLLLTLASLGVLACDKTVDVPSGDLSDHVTGVTATIHDELGSVVVVSWEQLDERSGWVEYSFDAGEWLTSPELELASGDQEQILLGIPYGTDVSLRLVNSLDEGPVASTEVSIATDRLPGSISSPTMISADTEQYDPDTPYLLVALWDWTVVVDREGRVVWALEVPAFRGAMQSQPSYDHSTLLIDHGSFWAIFDGGEASQVIRVKIDGTVLQTYDTPGLHHPFTEIADGSIVWSAIDGGNETLEKLTPAGEQQRIASCHALLGSYGDKGYCGSNTIRWRESTDSFLYSLYSHDTVFEVDHATGQALRSFGHHDDAWDFDPPSSAFWWQHGGHYTEAGTLITSSYRADEDDELVVREYELDEQTRTLTEIWSFGEGQGIHAETMGEVHRLPGGNTLHNYGSGARLREVTPEGEVVWDLNWDGLDADGELGRSTPLEDLYAFAP